MKYISRFTALLLALIMFTGNASALTLSDLTEDQMAAMYQAAAETSTVTSVTDVLGVTVNLLVDNGEALTASGATFQWYEISGEKQTAIAGATAYSYDVVCLLEEKQYQCLFEDADGNAYQSNVFSVTAQTDVLDDYLNTLYSDYDELYYIPDAPIDDYLAAAWNWMQTWNVTLADGTNLARNVLDYWLTDPYPEDMLCSCAGEDADFCILPPEAAHVESCGWHSDVTVMTDEDTGISVRGELPEGVSLSVTAATGPVPEIELIHFDITGLYPLMYRYNITLLDENGDEYVLPEGTTVQVTIPNVYKPGMQNPIVDVYHTRADGTVDYLTSMEDEVILLADYGITFETDGFSDYTVMVGAKEISVLNANETKSVDMAPGTSFKIGPYYYPRPTSVSITEAEGLTAKIEGTHFVISASKEATIGTTADVVLTFTGGSEQSATVSITVVEEKKVDASDINMTLTVESGLKETSWLGGGDIIQLYMAPDTAVKLNGNGFTNAPTEITHWKGSNVTAGVSNNAYYVSVLSDAQEGDQAKILITDANSGAFRAAVYVDVIAEKIPEGSDSDLKVEVGSQSMSSYYPDGSVARYKMAPDTTARVACGSTNLEAVSSMPGVVTAAVGTDGKTVYITTADTAKPEDTATTPAKITIRDKDTKIVKGIVYIDVIDAPEPDTLNYTDTQLVTSAEMEVSAYGHNGVRKYTMAPGYTVLSKNYGDVTVTVADDSVVAARVEDGTLYITANENAQSGQTTKLVVKNRATNEVVTTVFVEIILQSKIEDQIFAEKLYNPNHPYPIQIAVRSDGKIPGEPGYQTSEYYVYFDIDDNGEYFGERNDTLHFYPHAYDPVADEYIIDPDIRHHSRWKPVAVDGAETIGLYDATGETVKQMVNSDYVDWDELLDAAARSGLLSSADGVPLTTENQDEFILVPYVIKCQEPDHLGRGWHIDCAIVHVGNKEPVYLDYDINIPSGMTIKEPSGDNRVGLPNSQSGIPTATFEVGAMVNMLKNEADQTEYLIVNPDYIFTFIEWNTKADGSGDSYQPGGEISIDVDTTLYAIWNITPALNSGLLKVGKIVDDAEALGTEVFAFSIAIPNAAEEGYGYTLYGADNVAVKDEDGKPVTGSLTNGSTFTLLHGQYIIIDSLPLETITVTETDSGDYTPSWSGGTATGASVSVEIKDGRQSEVICTNAKASATSELTVIKTGMTDGESAIVKVTVGGVEYMLVLNTTNPQAVITNLAIGSDYTVTELDWAWKHTAEDPVYTNPAKKIVADATQNKVTISNTRGDDEWFQDESFVINDFSDGVKDEDENQ